MTCGAVNLTHFYTLAFVLLSLYSYPNLMLLKLQIEKGPKIERDNEQHGQRTSEIGEDLPS